MGWFGPVVRFRSVADRTHAPGGPVVIGLYDHRYLNVVGVVRRYCATALLMLDDAGRLVWFLAPGCRWPGFLSEGEQLLWDAGWLASPARFHLEVLIYLS